MRVRVSSLLRIRHTATLSLPLPASTSKHNSISYSTLLKTVPQYSSPVNAEPLHRYTAGGYHPITLGNLLHDGRYKILHKLGWGGYSTVWAARDEQYLEGRYVAINICVSENLSDRGDRQIDILKSLASSQHVVHILNHFDIEGPNGIHSCLVLEMLGSSVSDLVEERFADGRLPGHIAKSAAKQAMMGLNSLHRRKIAHGDFHIRNLAFTIPSMANVPEHEFIDILGKPDIGVVRRNDGKCLEPGIPEYIVRPASSHTRSWPLSDTIKIVDFGESFSPDNVPKTLHTPVVVRAPEVIFKDRLDYRVDLRSLGCMLFELFVGQPPFDNFLITPKILVEQMQEITNEALPERWVPLWESMPGDDATADNGPKLQEWLEETYFDGERKEELTRDDIVELGRIIRELLRFEPAARASVKEILNDPWFRE
ncbi:hypothetical protein CBS115989_1948 [Aspergillus niger]|uniref:Contig An07c0100, genomic contig n=4 Tax=Aspergillus niger TaxID=5061 RepID=A2QN11_ASPNC|nr:kinase-like protein [Aspergillus niger CBS 101883]XP_059605365.1 uncharacterized protein An07g04020 [Aspergillus niger]RDH24097.1 kinase-like protein [Aspergillus niger ATCC 13496]KAI2822557.1 hypothetical protein CBS115989_1948 [Aspergillus niger]KAI2849203.1 hypothetical protein CBS11350_2355 [Aspergillus niger]KAI2859930.1 hypothetical protein CBS11232_1859 [Aspergillus niger]KAI2875002.1 hypothetical protein CBS115988_5705 [Aspergillus niger]